MIKRYCQAYGVELVIFDNDTDKPYYAVNDYLGDCSTSWHTLKDAIADFKETVSDNMTAKKYAVSVVYKREMEANLY